MTWVEISADSTSDVNHRGLIYRSDSFFTLRRSQGELTNFQHPLLTAFLDNQLESFLRQNPLEITRDQDGQTLMHKAVFSKNLDLVRSLYIKNPKSVEYVNYREETPLHLAIHEKWYDCIRFLASKMPSLQNQEAFYTNCPVATAIKHGDVKAFNILVHEYRASIAREQPQKISLAHLAVKVGSIAIADCLFRLRVDFTQHDENGATPFHYAVEYALTQMVEWFIERKISGFCYDNNGHTPLHLAVIRVDNESNFDFWGEQQKRFDIARMLIQAQPQLLNAVNERGLTPLYYAVIKNHPKLRHIMLNARAPIVVDLYQGQALFFEIIRKGTPSEIQTWIEHGAMTHKALAHGNSGLSPLVIAVKNIVGESAMPPDYWKIIKLLIRYGQRLDDQLFSRPIMPDDYLSKSLLPKPISYAEMKKRLTLEEHLCPIYRGDTALHVLARCYTGDMQILKELIATTKPDLNIKNSKGLTPLHLALVVRNSVFARFLLEQGACPHQITLKGEAPAHFAAFQADYLSLRLLAAYDAITFKNNYQQTPFHYLFMNAFSKKSETFDFFMNNKAELNALDSNHMTPYALLNYFLDRHPDQFRGSEYLYLDRGEQSSKLLSRKP